MTTRRHDPHDRQQGLGGRRWRRRLVVVVAAVLATVIGATGGAPLGAEPPTELPEDPGVRIIVRTNGPDATFSFTSDIPGAASFDITTQHKYGQVTFDAPPGTYTVTELGPPAGFTFMDVTGVGCDRTGLQDFEVVVTADDVTSCVVQNNASGFSVGAVSFGNDATFSFTTDVPGQPTVDVTTTSGVGSTFVGPTEGTWTVTAVDPPAPFVFEATGTCPPGPTPNSVEVTVIPGITLDCLFTFRAPTSTVDGPTPDGPFPATTSVAVSSLPADDSTVGMGVALPAAAVPPGAPESRGTFGGISTENGASSNVVDPVGDVGPDHYVQMVNSKFAVFAKDGTVLAGPLDINALWTGAGGSCEASNDGDPIVLYDQLADRWMLSQFYTQDGGPYGLCVAVSQGPDPTGTYHLYDLPAAWNPDYPKFGISDTAYYATTQTGPFISSDLMAIDRSALLTGAPARAVRFSVNPTTFLLPADLDGATPPPPGAPGLFTAFEGPHTPAGGPPRLTVYAFDADFDDPASSTLELVAEVPIADFSPACPPSQPRFCIAGPEPGSWMDALDDIPMFRAAYRNFGDQQSIVGSFTHGVGTTDSPVAATRWWELRNTDGTWALHQEGDLAGGTLNRWASSTAQDRNGAVAVGYSDSDATTFPSIRYAARSPLDPLGAMGPEATMVEGAGMFSDRWGDYTALTVDPTDDCTFWYTNTYYPSSNIEISTAIGSFRRPDCAPVELSLSKTGPTSVAPGATIEHTLEYANAAGTASEVVLTETVPPGTTFAGGDGWTGCDIGAPAGTVCTYDIGGLAPGQRGTATFSVRVDDDSTGTVDNTAVLSAGYGGGAVTATATTPITASPAIAVVARPRFTG